MKTRVTLTLEYDLGDYSEEGPLSTRPEDYADTFYQGDIYPSDMKIVKVTLVEEPS